MSNFSYGCFNFEQSVLVSTKITSMIFGPLFQSALVTSSTERAAFSMRFSHNSQLLYFKFFGFISCKNGGSSQKEHAYRN